MEKPIKIPRFTSEGGFVASAKSSKYMSRIKSKDTAPEVAFRKALWAAGIRYRKDYARLKGKPDAVILKHRLAIFIDGDFWHGYNWEERKAKLKTNTNYWIPKIERNMQRDLEINQFLSDMGFTVLRFWEHEVKKHLPSCIETILKQIKP